MTQHVPNILVVDDDPGITELLSAYLLRYGFQVQVAADGQAMRRQMAAHTTDLVVLDLMLPGEDGLALAHALRLSSRVPIIMLTARGHAADRVLGLEMGADDYMAKPFEPRELVARIHTVLRRARPAHAAQQADQRAELRDAPRVMVEAERVRFGGWTLERDERRLRAPSGLVVPLSNAEYQLLRTFLQSPRRVVSREQLMTQARGRALDGTDRSIDLLVSRLRQKLSDGPDSAPLIKTVRGAGYLFDAVLAPGGSPARALAPA